jgi:hypothetical protein
VLGGDDEAVQSQIREAKELFYKAGLPALRVALANNTCNLVRKVFFELFNKRFPSSWPKADLLVACVQEVTERVNGNVPEEVVARVADFGVVRVGGNGFREGELILLCANSVDNTGADCVAAASSMPGWVCRDKIVVAVEVEECVLNWGELYLHQKVSITTT